MNQYILYNNFIQHLKEITQQKNKKHENYKTMT